MNVVIVYESMYGNTHLVADEIAAGLGEEAGAEVTLAVTVVPVDRAGPELVRHADLVVVGGPTHVHGMSRPTSRQSALDAARKPGSDLVADPDAAGIGLREWFDELGHLRVPAAAFDTRVDGPPAITGRASKGIAKHLRALGCPLVVEPESFLVDKQSHLLDDQRTHARAWGARLAVAMAHQPV